MSAIAGLVATSTVMYVTRDPAPGITGDSVFYLSGADALAKSRRLAYATQDWRAADSLTPMTRVMPGLSIVIASGLHAGADAVAVARVVQGASAFVTLFAMSWLAASVAGPITTAAVSASFLVLPAFLYVHLYVLTEPLFLALLLVALVLMARMPPKPMALGVVAALATAVRYPGVALTMAVCLWMLVQPGRLADKLRAALTAAFPTAILLLGWILHTRSDDTAEPMRQFAVYGGLGPAFRDAFHTIGAWLVPASRPIVRLVLATGIAAVLVPALVHELRRTLSRTRSDPVALHRLRVVGAAVLFILCYVVVIVGSRLFADPFIEFRARMLLPALVFAQIAIAITLTEWLRQRTHVVRWVTFCAVILWLGMSARISIATIMRERAMGLDIARPAVRESTVLDWLRTNAGAGRLAFSNHPLAVHHFLARDARWWPTVTTRDTLDAFVKVLRARNGLLVSFTAQDLWKAVAADSAIVRALGMHLVARLPDGSVWELPP